MTDFFLGWSYLGLAIILILTGAGLPLPEEFPIIAAGVLSSHGQMDPWLAFLACVIGAIIGDSIMYWFGRHFGRSILRKQGWWAKIIHPEREAKIERVIQQHGLKVLFSARFLVGVRAPVYIAAGILHLPYRRFILLDLFCATMVVGLFFGVSYYFGETITRWIKDAEYAATGLAVIVALVIIIYLWRRHRKKVAQRLKEELTSLTDESSDNVSDEAVSTEVPGDSDWTEPRSTEDQRETKTPKFPATKVPAE